MPADASKPKAPVLPTLADVARRAGVSTATVSRCLNAPDRVVKDTRIRVEAAIQDLGYAPNFSARALAAKRTNTIGAVIPTMENAIFARGLQAFQEELGRHGFTLLVASSSYREDLEAEQIRTLVARGADALLLIGYHRSPEVYDFLARRNVPVVLSWAYDPASSQAVVGFDNVQAMADLVQRVIALGHRNIAMISAPIATNDRARGRVEGARRALIEAGLSAASLHLVETQYGIDEGAAALRQIMGAAAETTVVLCGNDVLAIGAMSAAKAMGLSVPDDLSITGFDDMELARLADPALTTIHVPHRDMGRQAAEALVAAVADPEDLRRVQLATELRLRGTLSTARA